MKRWIIAVAGLTLSQALSLPANSAEQWQAYTYWGSPTTISAVGFRKLTDDIQAASNGALTVKFNLGGSLSIAGSNISEAVGDDVVQIADDAFFQGTLPGAGLLSLPFLIHNIDEMQKAVAIVRPYAEKKYKEHGVTLLGNYVYSPQVLFSRGSVTSLADIDGKKYRVTSPEQSAFVKAFGGIPVNLTSAAVPAALERGLVDGILTSPSGGAMAWKEMLKSSYRLGVNYPVSWIIVNTKRFDALKPEIQNRIKELVSAEMPKLTQELQGSDTSLNAEFSKGGMRITDEKEADRRAAQAKMTGMWHAWAKERGPEVVELLKQVRSALNR